MTRARQLEQIDVDLWKEYRHTKDKNIRNKLIEKYAYLVKYMASRLSVMYGKFVEPDDLMSFGIFGLIDAIEKFDSTKGVKFETYASLRIRGSIIDSIRNLDWVPRTLRQKYKLVEDAYKTLERRLGRMAKDTEVANYLNMSVDELNKILAQMGSYHILSLNETIAQNKEKLLLYDENNQVSPEAEFEKKELEDILAKAIQELPHKERIVISLYYYESLTLKEIGKVLDISESRVSQLHSKALLRLKGRLTSIYRE
ncbi:MAG TPA: FliA/WhiG family RNA polymerase sigma factor [Clostridiales bacterium]|nr:FliA/WhiG family RNA polymerase sigma factor [Clostridiales bacterium]